MMIPSLLRNRSVLVALQAVLSLLSCVDSCKATVNVQALSPAATLHSLPVPILDQILSNIVHSYTVAAIQQRRYNYLWLAHLAESSAVLKHLDHRKRSPETHLRHQYHILHSGKSAARSASNTPTPTVDATLLRQEIFSIRNKYARAAQILAGKGLMPAMNFSMVDEWTRAHAWDDPIVNEDQDTQNDGTDSSSTLNRRQSNQPQPWPLQTYIQGAMDISYYGVLSVGSPAQPIPVDIDTGSADLWVVSKDCKDCGSSSKSRYSSSQSSEFMNKSTPFHVGYGTGYVSGILSTDRVEIQGLWTDPQYFGNVMKQTHNFQAAPSAGLLGLAFGTIATSKQLPFFETLLRDRKVPAPYFGIHMTRGQTSGAELCIGCVDQKKWQGSSIQWMPVTSKGYWSVSFTGFRTTGSNRIDVPTKSFSAAIDSGTSLIYLPSSLVSKFYSTIPGAREATEMSPGIWTFPCNSNVDIGFEFDGKMFAMSSRDFNLGRAKKGSSECVGAVVGMIENGSFPSGLAVIGIAFLKSWYSIYDYSHGGRVGLIPSVTGK